MALEKINNSLGRKEGTSPSRTSRPGFDRANWRKLNDFLRLRLGSQSPEQSDDLLGRNYRTGPLETTETRISYKENKKIGDEYRRSFESDDNTEGLIVDILASYRNLTGKLEGFKLGRIYAQLGSIEESHECIDIEPESNKDVLRVLIAALTHLVYAVALVEGNLPPNDRGYLTDEAFSLVDKDRTIRTRFQYAITIILKYPDIFKSLFDDGIADIVGNIATRIESNMPTYRGNRIDTNPLPRLS